MIFYNETWLVMENTVKNIGYDMTGRNQTLPGRLNIVLCYNKLKTITWIVNEKRYYVTLHSLQLFNR